jgi:hypothetical protein
VMRVEAEVTEADAYDEMERAKKKKRKVTRELHLAHTGVPSDGE